MISQKNENEKKHAYDGNAKPSSPSDPFEVRKDAERWMATSTACPGIESVPNLIVSL
jgi:hypothetical protein